VEGATSFDGETSEVQPSIAKLVKRAGVPLVTYRFTGSYFTFPRWARFVRKGKMEGRHVQTYQPEQLAAMSEEEIFQAIIKDIYVNAYDDQEKNPIAFRGKNPAEYLETVLYCCPKCRQFGTLTSNDDIFSCTDICSFKVRYNEFCYFECPESSLQWHDKSAGVPFKTILDWAKWQRTEIETLAESTGSLESNTPIFIDENQELIQIEKTNNSIFVARGRLCLYKDRLSIIAENSETIDFPITTIIDMVGFAKMTIIFSVTEPSSNASKSHKVFEIHSKHPRSALKYIEMFKALKQK